MRSPVSQIIVTDKCANGCARQPEGLLRMLLFCATFHEDRLTLAINQVDIMFPLNKLQPVDSP